MTLNPNQFPPVYESDYGSAKVTPSGYVMNVHIKDEARGQGHGTALMHQITEDADRAGKELSLNAREELHPWYQKLGFQRIDDLVAEKILGQPTMVRKPKPCR